MMLTWRACAIAAFALMPAWPAKAVDDPALDFKPSIATPIGQRVFADLALYYAACAAEKDNAGIIPVQEMVRRLADSDTDQRREAGAYLYALCVQTEADDRLGRTPPAHGMPLGGGPREYGEQFRASLAGELSEAKFHGDGAEAFAAAQWLYQHDTWPQHRAAGVQALTRIKTAVADRLFVDMIQRADANFDILSTALEQAAERKLTEAAAAVRPLCRHYHEDIREAAQAAAKRLGLKDVGRYDRRTDLGPRLEPWLRTLLTALPEQVPAGATWRRFTLSLPGEADESSANGAAKKIEVCGWLLETDTNSYRVLDWTASHCAWSRTQTLVRTDSLRDFADRMLKLRRKYEKSKDNKERGEIAAQWGVRTFISFGDTPWPGSIPEVLAAAWSLERGDRETCGRLMVPLLEQANDEQSLLDHYRDQIAIELDGLMLNAFTGRNYDEALPLAKSLSQPFFDGYPDQDRAKDLAATLPQRGDDFRALTLVTPAAWQEIKQKLNRRQQVEYLARRLRLIQAMQQSIPGGINYSDTQYLPGNTGVVDKTQTPAAAEAQRDEAINPFNALLGMNLNGAELLELVPYLESPDYILAFDLHRFIPMNPLHLHKVSWVVGSIFNAVAQEELVDIAKLSPAAPEMRRRQIARVRQWCTDHAALRHSDLLAKTIAQAPEWEKAKWAFWGLFEVETNRALQLVVERCERDHAPRAALARLFCLLDRQEYLPRAREWMHDTDGATRFWGALLVLKHCDPQQPDGLDIVLEHLAAMAGKKKADKLDWRRMMLRRDLILDSAIETLLRFSDPRVKNFLSTYCGAKPHPGFEPSSDVIQRLFLTGFEPSLERLLYHLDDATPRERNEGQGLHCDIWLWWLSRWRFQAPPSFYHNVPKGKRAELIADMKHWLTSQFQLIKDGKSSTVIKQDLDLPWGEWREYSSGWIERL